MPFKQALSNVWQQKTQMTKKSEFPSQEAREFDGRWGTKNSKILKNTEIPGLGCLPSGVYNVQMDAAVLGDRLPEGTQKPLLGPGSPFLQCRALRELESACRVSIL